MKNKLTTILSVFLIALISTSGVGAAGAIKLSGSFGLGSLTFTGSATGLGGYRDGVTVLLTAAGIPVVTCTNQGGTSAPGQNPSAIMVSDDQFIGPQSIDKKGKAPVGLETVNPPITGTQGGCANDNWTATIDFVYWTSATLTAIDNTSGAVVATQNYTCVTTRNPDTVSCTQVP